MSKKHNFPISKLSYIFALIFSVVVLVLLRINNVALELAVLVIISYAFWFMAVHLQHGLIEKSPGSSDDLEQDLSLPATIQAGYFGSLHSSLERSWSLFQTDFEHCSKMLKSTHSALAEAVDAAGSTGMLALNAMMAATKTGEVGRGFVTVSKDLVAISEQSIEDLNRLRHIVSKAGNALDSVESKIPNDLDAFFASIDRFPLEEMERLGLYLQEAQEGLRELSDRYQKSLKSDVRWLQMGDAVRRLLNELINTLYQMELRLNDVLSDIRLLRLSGPLDEEQLLEIKGSIATIGATE